MHNARIDTTQGLDGEAVVLAVFDLPDEEIAASGHAVKAFSGERFRNAELSIDDVLELRELTALADELGDLVLRPGVSTLVMRPARLNAWSDALTLLRRVARRVRVDARRGPRAAVARARPAVAAGRSVCRRHARRAHAAGAQGLLSSATFLQGGCAMVAPCLTSI